MVVCALLAWWILRQVSSYGNGEDMKNQVGSDDRDVCCMQSRQKMISFFLVTSLLHSEKYTGYVNIFFAA